MAAGTASRWRAAGARTGRACTRSRGKERQDDSEHITDHDLERYHLGMVVDEAELAALEEHLLACPACVERAEAIADYVDAMRRAIIEGDHDR